MNRKSLFIRWHNRPWSVFRGIHVICWDDKADLVRALLVLQSAFTHFPEYPTLLPTQQKDLQRFGLELFENAGPPTDSPMRILLVPQASTEAIGTWLNGWRRRLSDPPGTLIVIRHADLMALYRRAPDLMSFAQSEIHEAATLLPLVTGETLERIREVLPDGWKGPLNSLPGAMPLGGDRSQRQRRGDTGFRPPKYRRYLAGNLVPSVCGEWPSTQFLRRKTVPVGGFVLANWRPRGRQLHFLAATRRGSAPDDLGLARMSPQRLASDSLAGEAQAEK